MLFGPHNAHLDQIERSLGVAMASRGNRVTITGTAESVERASDVLDGLYQRLERGQTIGETDVDTAVRKGNGAAADSGLTLVTRRKHIGPTHADAGRIHPRDGPRAIWSLASAPAGTGKTYLAVAKAVSMMIRGDVDRIVLSRPAVKRANGWASCPVTSRKRSIPIYARSTTPCMTCCRAIRVTKKMEAGEIEVAPLAFMRGRTLANSFVILDEAQNTTPVQMKMLLTRLGEHSRIVVTGDPSQGRSARRPALGPGRCARDSAWAG